MATSVIPEIQGTWLLLSMTYRNKDGHEVDLYGQNPLGILMYDDKGNMNAQMGFNNRSLFTTNLLTDGSPDEMIGAYKNYFAYYGKYWEQSPGVIVHEVVGCLFPNWQGKQGLRNVRIENDLLIIVSQPTLHVDGEIVIKAIWNRA